MLIDSEPRALHIGDLVRTISPGDPISYDAPCGRWDRVELRGVMAVTGRRVWAEPLHTSEIERLTHNRTALREPAGDTVAARTRRGRAVAT